VTCTIVVTNTSSDDAPNLVNGTIVGTRTGNLLDPANPAVDSSTCTRSCRTPPGRWDLHDRHRADGVGRRSQPALQHGDGDYNPMGFPNNITDEATDCVDVKRPGGERCTPGFWKQEQLLRLLGRLPARSVLRRRVLGSM
jgi:hypothetical protein